MEGIVHCVIVNPLSQRAHDMEAGNRALVLAIGTSVGRDLLALMVSRLIPCVELCYVVQITTETPEWQSVYHRKNAGPLIV